MIRAWLAAAPLPAVVTGAVVMARADVPPAIWTQNIVAALTGILLVLAAAAWRPVHAATLQRWAIPAAAAALGASLLAPGVEGIHRWLFVGPVQVHVGAVVLPLLLVLLGSLRSIWTAITAFVVLGVLWLQPDAAQAVAFALGWSASCALTRPRGWYWTVFVAILLAGAALLRPGSLEPVAHVEGIVTLAAGLGVFPVAASLIGLALVPLAPVLSPNRPVGAGLGVYVLCTFIAAAVGNYPVPYLGHGAAPIVGYYLAIAFLTSSDRWLRSSL